LNSFNGSIHHDGPQRKDESALGGTRFTTPTDVGKGAAQTKPDPIGSDLTPSDYAALESRWIDREMADRGGLRRVDSLTGGDIVGHRSGNYSGILIPYFMPGGNSVREYRLRRDHPEMEYDSCGNLKPRQKYLSPPGRSNMLYLAPGAPQDLLRDSSIEILITEGEFKTLALWRLAFHGTPDRPRFLSVGVSGVYNWRGTIGKTTGPDGSRLDVKGAIRDLDWMAWDGRRVVIAYDADAGTGTDCKVGAGYPSARARRHRWLPGMGWRQRERH
jgi:hypothetical protein